MSKRKNKLKTIEKANVQETKAQHPEQGIKQNIKPAHLFMKQYSVKIVAICAVVMMVAGFILFITAKISHGVFWTIAALCAIIAFLILPWIRGVMELI